MPQTLQHENANSSPLVLSVILPVYNEDEIIGALARRLTQVLDALGLPYEILWVDDGSRDDTAARLDALAASDQRHRVLHFSRNFGHMAALTAGLEGARASGAVVCMDSDGQHPPELLPDLVRCWQDGADIVQTIRRASSETVVKRVSSSAFYRVLNVLGEINVPEGAADFRLLDRQVVDALNNLPERVRFVRGLVQWVGFEKVYLDYQAPPRLAGTTKYSPLKMLQLAFGGITSFSVRPLRLAFLLSSLVIVVALGYAVFVLAAYLLGVELTPGWASTLLVMLLLGAAQLFAIGVASEYIARMFMEQKRRPIYILRKNRVEDRPGSGG